MAHVLQLKDGRTYTCTCERDFYDLIEEYMGAEAVDYAKSLIEDTCLLVQESADEAYEEMESKYEILREEYKHLEEQYEDLKYERGDW